MLTVDEAIDAITSAIPRNAVERVMGSEIVGRYLAESVEAPTDSPPFDNSAMDGWALRHADGEAPRTVVGEAAAGTPFEGEVGPGEAVRIFTGGHLPAGADTVVVQEECDAEGETVTPRSLPEEGANIRRQGENVHAGEIVLDVGDRVTPGDLGLLTSFKRAVFYAFRRPRVAILSSGDELEEVDRQLGSGSIINSNAYMLEGLVREAGGVPIILPIARDTMSDTRRAFADAEASADLIVSAGGVSVGEHDVVGLVIEELARGESHFWKVQMKPGKPLAFATTESGTPIIGLPGNPVSSFVGFHLFVGPAIRVSQSVSTAAASLPVLHARATSTFDSTPKREHFVMGGIHFDSTGPTFTPFAHQSSGNLRLLRGANAMARVAVGIDRVEEGEMIETILLPQ